MSLAHEILSCWKLEFGFIFVFKWSNLMHITGNTGISWKFIACLRKLNKKGGINSISENIFSISTQQVYFFLTFFIYVSQISHICTWSRKCLTYYIPDCGTNTLLLASFLNSIFVHCLCEENLSQEFVNKAYPPGE